MKLFKKLAVLSMSVLLCLGAGAALAACGDKESSSSSDSTITAIENGYTFKVVKADGSPAEGYMIQLCDAEGCLVNGQQLSTDANGILNFVPQRKAELEIHVMLFSDSSVKPTFEAKVNGTALATADKDGDGAAYPVVPSEYGQVIEITLK